MLANRVRMSIPKKEEGRIVFYNSTNSYNEVNFFTNDLNKIQLSLPIYIIATHSNGYPLIALKIIQQDFQNGHVVFDEYGEGYGVPTANHSIPIETLDGFSDIFISVTFTYLMSGVVTLEIRKDDINGDVIGSSIHTIT